MSAPGRVGYVDAMKGFACLTVVLGHIADGYLGSGMFPAANGFLYGLYNILYMFHMPLFMAISGYVYHAAYVAPEGIPRRDRIHRQVGNLAAVYFIFSIAFGLFKVAMGRFANSEITMGDVLRIPVKAINPYWYLYVLVFMYLLFSVKKLYELKTPVLLGALVVLSVIGSFVSLRVWFELSKNLYYPFFFFLGISLHREEGGWLHGPGTALAGFGLCVLLTALFWSGDRTINHIPLVNLLTAAGATLTLWYLFRRGRVLGDSRFLRFLGSYSLEIYVIHCVFTAGNRVLLPRLGITGLVPSMAVNMAVSTAIPVLFAMLLKRLGWHGLLFKPVSFFQSRKKTAAKT